jgi:hypothetical protein
MPEYYAKVFKPEAPYEIKKISFGESFSAADAWYGLHAGENDVAIVFWDGDNICTQPVDYTHPEDGDMPMDHFYRTYNATPRPPYMVQLYQNHAWIDVSDRGPFQPDEPEGHYAVASLNPDGSLFRHIYIDSTSAIKPSMAFALKSYLSDAYDVTRLIPAVSVALADKEYTFAELVIREIQDRLLNLCGRI